ncbi:hypothetical protein [Streptomyces longwoodensis]|uniref:hypothetical protein n=1 Tax=Streptomyces longwoodensis TaxID=68231 RepID=UPI002259A0B5|nr:hypothetical protein [Streptomyces longwoodensis]MCX4995857.1 hypothetical protein [Streptomyces longwoodensis]
MDREERVCPACGQSVETVVRRYKTLGAWVPRWGPGPCRNPGCEAYRAEEGEDAPHATHTEPERRPVGAEEPDPPVEPEAYGEAAGRS